MCIRRPPPAEGPLSTVIADFHPQFARVHRVYPADDALDMLLRFALDAALQVRAELNPRVPLVRRDRRDRNRNWMQHDLLLPVGEQTPAQCQPPALSRPLDKIQGALELHLEQRVLIRHDF